MHKQCSKLENYGQTNNHVLLQWASASQGSIGIRQFRIHQKLFLIGFTRLSIPPREGEETKMRFCPECGGEMLYSSATKRYACKSCGLSVTHQELLEMRDQMRPPTETEEEQRQRQRKEYLKWWLSDKKK